MAEPRRKRNGGGLQGKPPFSVRVIGRFCAGYLSNRILRVSVCSPVFRR